MARQLSLPWDREGALLSGLQVDFYAGGTPEQWRAFAQALGLDSKFAGSGSSFKYTFDLLGPLSGSFRDALFVELHSTGRRERDRGNIVHWHVKLRRMMSSTPPPEVERLSTELGGFPGGLERVLQHWPEGTSRSTEISYDVNYFVEPKTWTPLHNLPAPKSVSVDDGEYRLTPTLLSWTVSPPLGTISDITVGDVSSGATKILAVTARGKWDTELDAQVVDRLDREVWSGVAAFMKRKARTARSVR